MPRFCIFGGQDGLLSPTESVYITVFGGAELHRPSAARQMIHLRRLPAHLQRPQRYFFLTLFGGTEVSWPTLAEEYLALRDALRSGELTLEQWDQIMGSGGVDGLAQMHSLTLFGGFEADQLPSEEKELDALSLQMHLGQVAEDPMNTLMLAIGQRGAGRLAAVRHAAAAALSVGV